MYNPTRRNRNIGTAKQGHGQDNHLVIPSSWHDGYMYYEKLNHPVRIARIVNGKEISIIVEPPREGFKHCCTVDDICRMLSFIPLDDWDGLDIVVLRQPTKKQKILSSVWGRLIFFYESEVACGPAIILEAQFVGEEYRWGKSLMPDEQKELRWLEEDGHVVRFEKSYIAIKTSFDACRNTQLFRSLSHEIGHYLQYMSTDADVYQSLPHKEREDAANRYAVERFRQLRREGLVPFARILEAQSKTADGVRSEWFV